MNKAVFPNLTYGPPYRTAPPKSYKRKKERKLKDTITESPYFPFPFLSSK